MNIESMISMMKNMRIANAGNLTIGDILGKLSNFNEDENITFSSGKFFDGTYDSYRGYYSDLYVGFSDEDEGFNTVGKLKEVLNKALKDGEMEGYKGGEYPITPDTLVWFATYGTTYGSEMIIDIQKINGEVFVITKEEDY